MRKSLLSSALFKGVVVAWLLYLPIFLNRKWFKVEIPEILINYFTDLLCLPVVLGSTLILIQWIKEDLKIRLSVVQIAVSVIYFSIIFEWILPKYNEIYTSDIVDILCYILGGIMFYYLQVLYFRKRGSM